MYKRQGFGVPETGMEVVAVGDAIVDISGFTGSDQAFEARTELIWGTARNTTGWFGAIRRQRNSVHAALPDGGTDDYDLFFPDGAGGIVKNVFLTDIVTTNSAPGVQIITGTKFSTDTTTGFALTGDPASQRLAVPVVDDAGGDRQVIIQQPALVPGVTTDRSLDTRGLTRETLINLGLNIPIVNEAGDAFETTPTLPTVGGNDGG